MSWDRCPARTSCKARSFGSSRHQKKAPSLDARGQVCGRGNPADGEGGEVFFGCFGINLGLVSSKGSPKTKVLIIR